MIKSFPFDKSYSLRYSRNAEVDEKVLLYSAGMCYRKGMPSKNPEERRKAWRRWKARHMEQRREYQRIQKQAQYQFPTREQCSIKGCEQLGERHHPDYSRPKEIIWLCKGHHEGLHHSVERKCSLEGCERKHHAKGLCHMHLKRTNPDKYS